MFMKEHDNTSKPDVIPGYSRERDLPSTHMAPRKECPTSDGSSEFSWNTRNTRSRALTGTKLSQELQATQTFS